MKTVLVYLVGVLAFAGCTSVSGSLTTDIGTALPKPGSDVVVQGLLNAAYNLDHAVVVGALDANDPAPACLHAVLKDLGLEPAPGASPPATFTPKVSDLISAGSVLYIRARQVERLRGQGVSLSIPCKAQIGQMVLDAGKAAQDAGIVVPGASLLNLLPSLK